MTTWNRWPWRYRLGALFALMMLLQGASCPLDVFQRQTYTVPSVRGGVIAERFIDDSGRHYFLIEEIDRNGARGFRRAYIGSPDYQTIMVYFWANRDTFPVVFDRAGVPGGAGSLPVPAVQ
jgi:hypothetical protein